MMIAALLLAALSVEPQVFPEPLCENLPEVMPEVKAWVAHVAPELAQVSVRELSEKTALDVFGRATAAGWGSVDVLTSSVFREACTFYFSREALRAVDAAFLLDLVTVIRGQDKQGQDFEMTALLAGRGKLVVLYDRDGIVYRNERLTRDFRLAARVEFGTPTAGVLENIQGLCAKVRLFGCVRVRSLVKVGETLKVQAGTFTSETPLKPIQARASPVTPRDDVTPSAPRPVQNSRSSNNDNSKGGHHDPECYRTTQRAGNRQDRNSSVSRECSGRGTDRLAPAYRRNTLAGAGNRQGLFARCAARDRAETRALLGYRI